MKKATFLLMSVSLLFIVSSCKKSSSSANATGTLTVNIDGAKQTFNTGASAHLDNTGGFYSLSIIGVSGASASANSIIMEVTTQSAIVAGTYTAADNQSADISYTQAGSSVYQYDGTNGTSATITITSITATKVEGTFSGTLALVSDGGATTKTLTSGAFNLTIK